ncbi:pectate lyase family protein [Limnoglobus roseus]|uniref:Pectate lyase n=1 Tax=Limnoglobus roseus TaxID=2598579 RepID=A0A5C1AGJ8_9BACT|nr:T9SS C-terminal target domain-containing protein [Limnoglobus roseus]QEL17950.1 pectate lyase [Limnoglobus roseus]
MRMLLILTACLAVPGVTAADPRVDLNPDMPRADILAPGWDVWRVPDGRTATATFGGVKATLRAEGLTGAWWKPGLDYPARMASDGVTATSKLELAFAGLSAGPHTLATYHNALGDKTGEPLTVTVGGQSVAVTPSHRVKHDADAASAFVTFVAAADQDVVVTFTAAGTVTLNGFEIDRSDPVKRAAKPTPSDDDEHAPENPVLTWRAAKGAMAHRVFLGTDPATLQLRGESTDARFDTAGLRLDNRRPYFWRVDTVHPAGVIPGEVWRFRVRHLAFPEAEGYGRFAFGGRGGKVYEVTTLDDAGPGSLREAVEASGPRTVVFRVGGLIVLKSKLIVRHPYLTVAGQTAPGDGICLKNYTFGCSDTHDVIIRYVRIRVGDETGLTQDGSGARGSDHVIFDHCSISWSIDEGFSSREGRNLTVQRCLIAEALNIANHKKYEAGKGHSFAGSISGGVGSFHHNLLAHCTGRNWSLAGGLDRSGLKLAGQLDIRNNVVFNWQNRTTDGGVRELNFVGNFYLPGPATKTYTLLKPDPGDPERGMRAHMAGNVIDGKPSIEADNWSAYVGPADGQAKVRSADPVFEPFVKTHSAREALDSVLADVGANRPKQDAVDLRVLADVRKRGHTFTGSRGKLPGIIDTPTDAGGWPAYQSAVAPPDADHDGISDAWEKTHGLDPANPADAAAYRPDGYTHLEAYLNELARP